MLEPERGGDEPAMIVDVEGFEGPLDLLLTLARQQKVDLAKISILALADQYLRIHRGGAEAAARTRRRLSGDGGVARLPEIAPAAAGAAEPDGGSAEDMATALAQRLRRLEAIRQVAEQLLDRPQLGREIFARGLPEPIAEVKRPEWSATLYDLLSAYAGQRQKQARAVVRVAKRTVWSLAEAREAIERLVGYAADWSSLDQYLIEYMVEPALRATVLASSFAATLELVREGRFEVHQHGAFTPLFLRKRRDGDGAGAAVGLEIVGGGGVGGGDGTGGAGAGGA